MARDFLFGFWKLWLLLHHNRCYLFNNALDQPLTNPLPFEVGIRRADCAEFGAMLGNGSSRGLLFTGGYGRCFTDNPRRVNCFDTRAHLLSTKCLTRLLRSGGHLLARLVADNELTQVRRRRPFLLFVIAFATAFDVEARASLHEGVHCSPPLGTSTSATWVPPGLLLGCTPTHTSNSRVRERFSFNAELPPPHRYVRAYVVNEVSKNSALHWRHTLLIRYFVLLLQSDHYRCYALRDEPKKWRISPTYSSVSGSSALRSLFAINLILLFFAPLTGALLAVAKFVTAKTVPHITNNKKLIMRGEVVTALT